MSCNGIVSVPPAAIEKLSGDNTSISWMLAIARAYGLRADVLGYQEGCSKATKDCALCWALEEVWRRGQQANTKMQDRFGGLTVRVGQRPEWTGVIRYLPEGLSKAIGQKFATAYFPASRSDIFHEKAERRWILAFLATAAIRPDHLFVAPTKRWRRASEILTDPKTLGDVLSMVHELCSSHPHAKTIEAEIHRRMTSQGGWPLKNFWIGASIGEQAYADTALPHMAAISAAGWFTWVSSEPRRGPVNWAGWESIIHWLVVGGQSGGAAATPMHPSWPRSDLTWCRANHIPMFHKQWGEWAMHPERGEAAWVAADGAIFTSMLDADVAGYPAAAPPVTLMYRCGSRASGHLLDGQPCLEVPKVKWCSDA